MKGIPDKPDPNYASWLLNASDVAAALIDRSHIMVGLYKLPYGNY